MLKGKQEKSDLQCTVCPGKNTMERAQRLEAGSSTMTAVTNHFLKCSSHFNSTATHVSVSMLKLVLCYSFSKVCRLPSIVPPFRHTKFPTWSFPFRNSVDLCCSVIFGVWLSHTNHFHRYLESKKLGFLSLSWSLATTKMFTKQDFKGFSQLKIVTHLKTISLRL